MNRYARCAECGHPTRLTSSGTLRKHSRTLSHAGTIIRVGCNGSTKPGEPMPSKKMITYRPKGTAITLDELREFVEATKDLPGDADIRVSTLFQFNNDGGLRVARIAVEG